jgi:hypothetical protein
VIVADNRALSLPPVLSGRVFLHLSVTVFSYLTPSTVPLVDDQDTKTNVGTIPFKMIYHNLTNLPLIDPLNPIMQLYLSWGKRSYGIA